MGFVFLLTGIVNRFTSLRDTEKLMLSTIDPLLIFLTVAIITGTSIIVLSQFIGPRKNTAVKLMPYESGMDPIGDARQRFDVR